MMRQRRIVMRWERIMREAGEMAAIILGAVVEIISIAGFIVTVLIWVPVLVDA